MNYNKIVIYKNNIFKYSDFQDTSCVLTINNYNYGYICLDDFTDYEEELNYKELTKEIYNYIQENVFFYGEEIGGFINEY